MADDNRFFRWLWRVNSILFFLGVLGLMALVGIPALSWFTETHEAPATAQTAKGGDTYEFNTTGLGDAAYSALLTHLDGTEEGVAVLQRVGPGGSYSLGSRRQGYESSTVNLLSVDLKTLKNRWLFSGVKRDIQSVYRIHASVPVPQNGSDPVTALLMDVADADTNGDGKVTDADRHSLYVYRAGSAAPVKLVDAWWVSGVEQLDGERVVVTYYDGKVDHAVLLSAKDFHVVADTILSATPK